MFGCEDVLTDEESDSPFEPEVQEYIDSDKADSDLEIELYSQIHFTEDLNATASSQCFENDSSYIFDVTPVKSFDAFPFLKPKTELPCDVNQETPEAMKLNHFESSTPKISVKNNLIAGKQVIKAKVGSKVKLPKAKTGKVALGSAIKPSKSSEDSGCFESATCSDNHDDDDDDTDDSVVILDSPNVMTNDAKSKEVIVLDSSPSSNDVSVSFGHNSVSSETSDSEDSSKFTLSAPSSATKKSVSSETSDSEDSSKFTLSAPSSATKTSGDLWRIDYEDRFAFIKKQKRYHEKHSSICNNCKKKGHLSKDCLEPRNMKCYICGRDHVWSMCHQRMCGRCFEYGHIAKRCRYKGYELSCNLCKMKGHTVRDCPDLWRRYHLTTTPNGIVKGSKETTQGVKKYCYNCGHEGHYGHECLRPRMSPDSFPSWPMIISYKDPYRQFKKHPKKSNMGESSNCGRHYDSYPRHKHKKHRSRADELRAAISEKRSENSKKARNKDKFHNEKYSPLRGNDFPRSSQTIVLDEEGHKNKKKRKRDIDKLYAFKRKKQKLSITV